MFHPQLITTQTITETRELPASNVYLDPTGRWHSEWAAIFRGDIAR